MIQHPFQIESISVALLLLFSNHLVSSLSVPYTSKQILNIPTLTQLNCNKPHCLVLNRKQFFHGAILISSNTFIGKPKNAMASNMPKNNGADLSKTNTVETLIPIIQLQKAFLSAKSFLNEKSRSQYSPNEINSISRSMKTTLLSAIIQPNSSKSISTESDFKKIFDAYSDPISYKQKFMDQNAFLVYYTQGYDGPNRPKMEEAKETPKQTLQYGYRNEAWIAYQDLMEELNFSIQNAGDGTDLQDLIIPLDRALNAFEQYFALVPNEDLQQAILACS